MTKIITHHDADGLISAYLTSFAVKSPKILVAEKFGDTLEHLSDGTTQKLGKDSYMTDMRPDDPTYEGTVIDHHPGHPGLADRKYSLVWDQKPASILAWQKFKDKIPKSEWWKTMIGATGDGQPEKVPYEIWKECPQLMQKHKTFLSHSYGEWKVSYRPAYELLSSGVNAFARYGEYDTALRLIKKAKEPRDVINNPEFSIQKNKLSNTKTGDFAKVMQDAEIYPLKYMTLCIYNSPNIRLSGYIASVLSSQKDNMCVLAINKDNGSLSLRGQNANFIRGELNQLDYIDVDGHDGFCGGHISKSPYVLYKDIMGKL
jgi:hypothetical protein